MLLDSYQRYQKQDINSVIKIKEMVKNGTLKSAIEDLLEYSLNELNLNDQNEIFKASVFGKNFCDEYPNIYFMEKTKRIRFLNSLKSEEFGIPIIYQQ